MKSAKEFFKSNKIKDIDSKDDIYLHDIRDSDKLNLEKTTKSFFTEGVRLSTSKTARGSSILGTVCLQKKDVPLDEAISNYHGAGDGSWKVILKIPRVLKGIFLGNCKPKYEPGGNQNGKNSILDFFDFNNIPREFIVGMAVRKKSDPNSYDYIQNPYYYDHKENKEANTKSLVGKLKEKIKSKGLEDLTDDKFVNKENIEFSESINSERGYFFKQKNKYLQEKSDNKLLKRMREFAKDDGISL